MTFWQYFLTIVLILSGLTFEAKGQRLQLRFERIGVKEGISVPTIRKVVQDQNGFLWIATGDGLNRYDGSQVKVYRHLPQDSTSLTNSYIRTILIDSKQRLWVGTWWGGLCLYHPEYDNFEHFTSQEYDSSSLSHNNVNTIFEDNQGNIWVGTWNGLNLLDVKNKKFKRFLHDEKNPFSLGTESVNTIVQDPYNINVLWIGTYLGGVDKFDIKTGRFQHFRHNLKDENSLSHDDIRDTHVDKKGRIWFATPQGITIYLPQHGKFKRIQQETYSHKGLLTNDILSILNDTKGRIWIGTGQGLYYYDEKEDKFHLYVNSSEDVFSLSENSIICLYEDNSQRLWRHLGRTQ
jgi:ligand-binding sensor domain-containing protein